MQKRTLGTQGLTVSPLGLGCMGMSDAWMLISEALPKGDVAWQRYPEAMMKLVGR